MLQNVHRGGQGQTLGLVNLSTPPPPSFALLAHQQFQRPTTYRPIREDPAQPDRRIPNSLQAQQPLAQQLRRLHQSASYPTPGPTTAHQIAHDDDDVASLESDAYQERYESEDDPPAVEKSRDEARHQNSYARLLRFQGDRRVDSFVRY